MADPEFLAFIREYNSIFLRETMKSNDYTLVSLGHQCHHLSRKLKYKNVSRASGGIGILVANTYEKHTRIDSTYDHLVWLTVPTEHFSNRLCLYTTKQFIREQDDMNG